MYYLMPALTSSSGAIIFVAIIVKFVKLQWSCNIKQLFILPLRWRLERDLRLFYKYYRSAGASGNENFKFNPLLYLIFLAKVIIPTLRPSPLNPFSARQCVYLQYF